MDCEVAVAQIRQRPENEFAMIELARSVGIDVPETMLIPVKEIQGIPAGIELAGDMAFAIKRFDRDSNGRRVHIEDFAQVFGVYPERKYQNASYRNIAQVLWVETGEAGIAEFLRRFVFNALIGNADMHLKNWSLIYPVLRCDLCFRAYPLYPIEFVVNFLLLCLSEISIYF